MAYLSKKDQRGYIEFSNFPIDYNDGDVAVYENVKDLTRLYPLKPMTNLIVLCNAGDMQLCARERTMKIGVGDVLVCPPNIRIDNCDFSDNFRCQILCLSDHIIQALLRDRIELWHHAIYVNQVNVISMPTVSQEEFGFYYAIIHSKLQRTDRQAPYEILQALLRALLLELCFLLEDLHGVVKEHKLSQGKLLFNRFLSLISTSKIKRQPINTYANQLAITPKYLTMLCLKYSDKTASEWVSQYTIEEIRFYLRNTELSIKEISAKMGFANMSHFGSYVRKHLGMSPSEYREKK
jgi:AraC-like DNA-binding protein